MGMFGWSYPPGCSGVPDDERHVHPKSEEVWALLENAGVDESIIEQVCKVIDELAEQASRECPRCLAATWLMSDDAGVAE